MDALRQVRGAIATSARKFRRLENIDQQYRYWTRVREIFSRCSERRVRKLPRRSTKPSRPERARCRDGADAGRNPAATLRMRSAQCGGEAAKSARSLRRPDPHQARVLLLQTNPQQRPRSSQISHRDLLPPGGIDDRRGVTAPLSSSRMKRIARRAADFAVAVAPEIQ